MVQLIFSSCSSQTGVRDEAGATSGKLSRRLAPPELSSEEPLVLSLVILIFLIILISTLPLRSLSTFARSPVRSRLPHVAQWKSHRHVAGDLFQSHRRPRSGGTHPRNQSSHRQPARHRRLERSRVC